MPNFLLPIDYYYLKFYTSTNNKWQEIQHHLTITYNIETIYFKMVNTFNKEIRREKIVCYVILYIMKVNI